jgi:hypothetical protein
MRDFHAVNLGVIESNPWHDVKMLGKVKSPQGTEHYTLEEIEDIISALVDHTNCQAIMALAFFLGLRPGEIAGLRWSDVEAEWLHIRIRCPSKRWRNQDRGIDNISTAHSTREGHSRIVACVQSAGTRRTVGCLKIVSDDRQSFVCLCARPSYRR